MEKLEEKLKALDLVNVRLVRENTLVREEGIYSPEDAVRTAAELIGDYDREVLCILNLNVKNQPCNLHLVSIGTLQNSVVNPREILKSTFLSNAASIILLHNHPSANLEPSRSDINFTKRIEVLCDLAGIRLIDHVIANARGECYSFMENRLIQPREWSEGYSISEKPAEEMHRKLSETLNGLDPKAGDYDLMGYMVVAPDGDEPEESEMAR